MLNRTALANSTAIILSMLIALCLAWELWLAPLRQEGSLLALKALPLLMPLFGVLRERRYTYQWSSMLVLAYFAEGCVRAFAESGIGRGLAVAETLLSIIYFCLAIAFVKSTPSLEYRRTIT